jgi:hypothetical protein
VNICWAHEVPLDLTYEESKKVHLIAVESSIVVSRGEEQGGGRNVEKLIKEY